jgi:virginiamycin B lyase
VGAFHDATWHDARGDAGDVDRGRHRSPQHGNAHLSCARGGWGTRRLVVWFTPQSADKLGRLDPRTGKSDLIALGPGAAPHGVIVGLDGAAWTTEGGQDAIAGGSRDPRRQAFSAAQGAPLGEPEHSSLRSSGSTLVHRTKWSLWPFRPQIGDNGSVRCAARTGRYGITTTPDGRVFLLPLPAAISVGSISRPAPPRSWSRPCRGKAHGASRATAAANCGLPIGTAEISSATIAGTIVRSTGIWRATGRSPTLSTSMTPRVDAT